MKLWTLLFGLLTVTSALGFESINKKPLITAQEILYWVSEQSDNPVRSVEELLNKLPEAYRKYFVLQYESFSNHSADSTHPRVIFFGSDAKLLLAFSGLPSDLHYDTIEMIQYEPTEASFNFYSIHFQPSGLAQVEIKPKDCNRCHGWDPKPNWEPYSLWPGTFGSLHDRILPRTQEHVGFEKFLHTYKTSSRYKILPGPFHIEAQESLFGKTYHLSNSGSGPGSSLSILLGFLTRDRLVKKMVSSSWHSLYRPALTAAMLNCETPIELFIPDHLRKNHLPSFSEVLKETKQYMAQNFSRKIKSLMRNLNVEKEIIFPHADLFGFRAEEVERIAKLRFLIQKRPDGFDFDRSALSISKTSLDFNDGVGGLRNLIGHYVSIAYENSDPFLKTLSLEQVPFAFTKDYQVETFSVSEKSKEACDFLLKEAQAISLSK